MHTEIAVRRPELLSVAESVAREKRIPREEVLTGIEEAIQRAAAANYGPLADIRTTIDRKTGDVRMTRWTEIVDQSDLPENKSFDAERMIDIGIARRFKADARVGEFIVDPLPPIDFGRIAAQTARQVITQKVRESERKRVYEEYKDRVGEIVSGVVRHIEFDNLIVDLGNADAILRRNDRILREPAKAGDRVRAVIAEVEEDARGPQVRLSRTTPMFLVRLFAQEVPEIYDGVIEIKAVARDPGSRAKIAVISKDSSIDPIGACIGMRGSRIRAVSEELMGEKIDVINWSPQPAVFICNALAPAEVTRVILDDESGKVDVILDESQLSLAIGRRGQNVRLASQLTKWSIDLMTEGEQAERREGYIKASVDLFQEKLDCDEFLARLLVGEGFATLEDLALSDPEEIATIEGLHDFGAEIVNRAIAALEKIETERTSAARAMGVSEEILAVAGIPSDALVLLANHAVLALDDLADLSTDELLDIVGDLLDRESANEIIMTARAHWFPEETAEAE